MLARERQNTIVEIVNREGSVRVKNLSKKFGVTEDSIRKDLAHLEKEVIAQLTINNMIPVIDDVVHKVNIKNDKSKYYLYRELYFLRKYDVIQEILNKAEKVLNVLNDKNNIDFDFFKVVCCNFKLLEMKSNEWKNINNKNL